MLNRFITEEVQSIYKKNITRIGGAAGFLAIIGDFLEPIAPFSQYLFFIAIVILLFSIIIYFFSKNFRHFILNAIIFSLIMSIISGAICLFNEDKKSILASAIPGVEKLQKITGVIYEDIKEIKTTTKSIKEDTSSIKKSIGGIGDKIDEINDNIGKQGGVIKDPSSVKDYYHNAIVFENNGEHRKALKAYYKYFQFNQEYIDPYESYIALLKDSEGRIGAIEIIEEMAKEKQNLFTDYALALLQTKEKRRSMLQIIIDNDKDFLPAYERLASEYNKKNVLEQKKAFDLLNTFLNVSKTKTFTKYFIDKKIAENRQQVAQEKYDELKIIHHKLVEPLKIKVSSNYADQIRIFSLNGKKKLFNKSKFEKGILQLSIQSTLENTSKIDIKLSSEDSKYLLKNIGGIEWKHIEDKWITLTPDIQNTFIMKKYGVFYEDPQKEYTMQVRYENALTGGISPIYKISFSVAKLLTNKIYNDYINKELIAFTLEDSALFIQISSDLLDKENNAIKSIKYSIDSEKLDGIFPKMYLKYFNGKYRKEVDPINGNKILCTYARNCYFEDISDFAIKYIYLEIEFLDGRKITRKVKNSLNSEKMEQAKMRIDYLDKVKIIIYGEYYDPTFREVSGSFVDVKTATSIKQLKKLLHSYKPHIVIFANTVAYQLMLDRKSRKKATFTLMEGMSSQTKATLLFEEEIKLIPKNVKKMFIVTSSAELPKLIKDEYNKWDIQGPFDKYEFFKDGNDGLFNIFKSLKIDVDK